MVVNGERELNGDRTDEILNPLLVVEIFSPTTAACDRGEKFRKYLSIASFCEYLRVSQAEPYIEQYYNGERQNIDC
jgi:Uma2 family endonuclease